MYAIAMNNFAKRINSTVNSDTKIAFNNNKGAETKETSTLISYQVNDTKIREHVARETGTYKYAGKTYTFVKLSMKKDIFDALISEAKATGN